MSELTHVTCCVVSESGEHCPEVATESLRAWGQEHSLCRHCAANVRAGAYKELGCVSNPRPFRFTGERRQGKSHASESEKRFRRAIANLEDEARPPYDRSAILPNRDGTDAWLFEKQEG